MAKKSLENLTKRFALKLKKKLNKNDFNLSENISLFDIIFIKKIDKNLGAPIFLSIFPDKAPLETSLVKVLACLWYRLLCKDSSDDSGRTRYLSGGDTLGYHSSGALAEFNQPRISLIPAACCHKMLV